MGTYVQRSIGPSIRIRILAYRLSCSDWSVPLASLGEAEGEKFGTRDISLYVQLIDLNDSPRARRLLVVGAVMEGVDYSQRAGRETARRYANRRRRQRSCLVVACIRKLGREQMWRVRPPFSVCGRRIEILFLQNILTHTVDPVDDLDRRVYRGTSGM
jgi:hypothetical protein